MKFLVYILIFSSYSQADYLVDCIGGVKQIGNLSEYFEEKNKKHNLKLVCKAAETKAENCCGNPKACPGWKDTTVNIINDLSQAAAMALGPTYQMSGDRMKACELGNMSSALGHTSSALKSIQTDKCSKASEKCSETCENKYKDFLVEFISPFIKKPLTETEVISTNNGVPSKTIQKSISVDCDNPESYTEYILHGKTIEHKCNPDKDVTFEDLTKYIKKPKKIKVGYFRDISKAIFDRCKEDDLYNIEKELDRQNFDENNKKLFKNYVTFFNPLEDCEDLTKNNELAEAGIQQLQLQVCQEVRAATQQNPINVRTPGTSSTDLTGTQFAFNQDEGGPGATPAPDDSVVPLDDDGFPEGAKPADTEQFGFGRIEKNGSPGGSPGGGPGLGGGTPNYDDYGGANYDTLPDDYGHWEVGAGPGGGFGPYGDDEDSNAYRYPSGEGEGDGSDKVALGDGSDVDLDQYIDIDANEKSIFQIVSLRIQEYCSTKIKEQCL